jgi:hypothetical protein
MSAAFEIRPRSDIGRERWDAFVDASDQAWLWHRWDLIDALALWPGYRDASYALMDGQGRLLAVMPLHRIVTRVAGVMPVIRLSSLGGPACVAGDGSDKTLSALRDHLLQLLDVNDAISADVQIAPLTPSLEGPGAAKINPLVVAGFANTQTETWMVGLAATPDEIRRRYSELTRRELRKASQSETRVREAAGTKDLEIYYRLHRETYARTGAKPHPIGYFQAIFEKFQPRGLARILFAERRGNVVAAQNTGRYKAGAVYWTGASISEKEGGENRVLFDTQIMAARDDGCTRYETGQAFVNSSDAKELGLSRFKRSFGADMRPFYRGVLHSQRLRFRVLRGLHGMVQTLRSARP